MVIVDSEFMSQFALVPIETQKSSGICVVLLKEFTAGVMIFYFFCTAKPNPALVSRAELTFTELAEQGCEGQTAQVCSNGAKLQ